MLEIEITVCLILPLPPIRCRVFEWKIVLSHDTWSRQRMQSGGFFRGYTKLCKGLAVILLLVHLLVQLFPSAVTYLALIPGR